MRLSANVLVAARARLAFLSQVVSQYFEPARASGGSAKPQCQHRPVARCLRVAAYRSAASTPSRHTRLHHSPGCCLRVYRMWSSGLWQVSQISFAQIPCVVFSSACCDVDSCISLFPCDCPHVHTLVPVAPVALHYSLVFFVVCLTSSCRL